MGARHERKTSTLILSLSKDARHDGSTGSPPRLRGVQAMSGFLDTISKPWGYTRVTTRLAVSSMLPSISSRLLLIRAKSTTR